MRRPFRSAIPLVMAIWAAAPLGAGAAQVPSILVPSTRADQRPVVPTYRRPALEAKPAVAVPSFRPFRLLTVEIRGSSLPSAVQRASYAGLVGRTVTAADLNALVQALASAYAARSDIALYGLSIPAQAPQGGRLVVDATEGYLQGARVTAPAGVHGRYRLLRRYLDRLTAERPLRRSSLERYSALIRDIAGLNAQLSFAQGTRPGGFVLVVAVDPRTAELGLGVNNRGTAFLGRTQAEVDLALHSLLREGDDTHLTFAAPTDIRRFQYYGLSHGQPIGASGASVTGTIGYLQTRPDFLDLHGHALTLGLSAIAPVLRRNDQSLYLTAGLDGVNSSNALLGDQISDDRVRTLRFGGTYVRQMTRYYLLVNGSANIGLDGLGARTLSPTLSSLDFRKYTGKVNLNVALPADFVLRLDGAGQVTSDRLPGSEQLALGGDEFGRAYEAAVIAGDKGVAGSAELAWKAVRIAPALLRGSEVYAFADGGETRRVARPSEPAADQEIASIGAGGRLAVSSKAVFQLEAARGLLNPLATEDHESWRAVFSVKSLF